MPGADELRAEEWVRSSTRAGVTLVTPSAVERIGDFARVRIETVGRGLASVTYYLLLFDGEWVVVGDEWMVS